MLSVQESLFDKEVLRELFASRIVKSRAVGLDGTRLEMFEGNLAYETALIERKVLARTYSFTTYREKLISKGADQHPRQISIPTVRDRLTLRSVCNALTDNIPSARSKPPHNYIKQITSLVRDSREPLSFLRVDIRNFFPTIKHDALLFLLERLGCEPFLIDLIYKAIANGTGLSARGKVSTLGIPQGLSISNLLSSIYMTDLDSQQATIGNYHRYVDDILIVEPSHTITKRYMELHASLIGIGLEPHPMDRPGKTEIKRIGEGIDYLGYRITPQKNSVRTSSYNRMFANLSKVFTSYKYKKNIRQFLFKLNIRITGCVVDGKRKGWLMFFSQTDDVSQLKYLDQFVESQCKKLNVDTDKAVISRFVKAYHEIRYRGVGSSYIPNFDSFTLDQQYQLISNLTGATIEELGTRSREATDYEFKALVAREVADLEQDVLNAVS
jgi:RNA-directed DNA polymerase